MVWAARTGLHHWLWAIRRQKAIFWTKAADIYWINERSDCSNADRYPEFLSPSRLWLHRDVPSVVLTQEQATRGSFSSGSTVSRMGSGSWITTDRRASMRTHEFAPVRPGEMLKEEFLVEY